MSKEQDHELATDKDHDANGDAATTRWGAVRARNSHPAPPFSSETLDELRPVATAP